MKLLSKVVKSRKENKPLKMVEGFHPGRLSIRDLLKCSKNIKLPIAKK